MALFFKAAAAALITAIVTLVLNKQEKDMGLMATMAACSMGMVILLSYLEPVLDFLRQLQTMGDLNGDMLSILMKAVGIGLVAEIAGLICTDAGNASLGKTMQLLGAAVILWLSIPVFQMLLDLMTQILGEV